MGADRKGPLAAFIVIAIVAAVLLVTTVRSQAAPGWLDPDKLPASVVAGPVSEPHLWGSVVGGVNQVVQDGTVLVRRATTGPSDDQDRVVEAVDALTSVAADAGDQTPSGTRRVAGTHRHAVTTPRHLGPDHDGSPLPPTEAQPTPSVPTAEKPARSSVQRLHHHGRHLGWSHRHGQNRGHAQGHGRSGRPFVSS